MHCAITIDAIYIYGTPTKAGKYTVGTEVFCTNSGGTASASVTVKEAGSSSDDSDDDGYGGTVIVTPGGSTTPVTPDPYKDLPKITKSPTDETVDEGGSCSFIGNYENAIWAAWHFVSPDGKTDYRYEKASEEFKPVVIEGGDVSHLKLKNIPYSLNGWRVYCEYSNYAGAVRTDMATIRVNPAATPSPSPMPTPTPETTPIPTPEVTIAPPSPTPTLTVEQTPAPTPTPAPTRSNSNLTSVVAISAAVIVCAICGTILALRFGGKRR